MKPITVALCSVWDSTELPHTWWASIETPCFPQFYIEILLYDECYYSRINSTAVDTLNVGMIFSYSLDLYSIDIDKKAMVFFYLYPYRAVFCILL